MTEADVIAKTQDRLSELNWQLGEIAAQWVRQVSRGRSLREFAGPVGVDHTQLQQCHDVYTAFADVRHALPNCRWAHFHAALGWGDAFQMLTWANDVVATVAEMQRFRAAMNTNEPDSTPPRGRLF